MQNIENTDIELSKKIDGIYKEILSNILYVTGCSNPRELNKEDIKVFFQALNKLYELEEEYNQSFYNRQSLGNKISSLASHLIILADRVQNKIRNDADCYKTSNELFIRDFEKIMYILFNAQSSSDFALKKIYVEGIGSFEIKHGTKETKQINGIVYIIGDSVALSKLEDEKVYWESDIRGFTTKILESEKSLIIASNYYFNANLLPYTNINSCLEISLGNLDGILLWGNKTLLSPLLKLTK